ncbi:MAG: hypothetical protein ABFD69_12915 [Candidatus Sumerlaeia bacterium]
MEIATLVAGLVIGLVINTFVMWVVASYLLSIPGIKFVTCFKAVVGMIVVTAVMFGLAPLFGLIPFFPGIIWLLCFFAALRGIIEGVLDVPSGGGTILILFSIVQFGLFYVLNQAMSAAGM